MKYMKISLLAKLVAVGRNDMFLFHFSKELDILQSVVAGDRGLTHFAEYLYITPETLGSIQSNI